MINYKYIFFDRLRVRIYILFCLHTCALRFFLHLRDILETIFFFATTKLTIIVESLLEQIYPSLLSFSFEYYFFATLPIPSRRVLCVPCVKFANCSSLLLLN